MTFLQKSSNCLLKNFYFYSPKFEKVSLRVVEGYIYFPSKMQEGVEALMENAQELIGILQAISIVAKSLAAKLMRIEQQIRDYEAAGQAGAGRKNWKGK